jgi:hypothetical protein
MSEPPIHVSAEGAHAHPRHIGQRWLDLAIALSAIFISLVSLVVAIEHGKTERDLVAANSWPFLRGILSNSMGASGGEVVLGASNGGVGPAKVRSFEVFYRGQPVSSGPDLLRRCCGLSSGPVEATHQLNGYRYSIIDDTVLRPGENNIVVDLKGGADAVVLQRFRGAVSQVTYRACYCSILDECWVSDLMSLRVQPVKACSPPAHPFNPNGK